MKLLLLSALLVSLLCASSAAPSPDGNQLGDNLFDQFDRNTDLNQAPACEGDTQDQKDASCSSKMDGATCGQDGRCQTSGTTSDGINQAPACEGDTQDQKDASCSAKMEGATCGQDGRCQKIGTSTGDNDGTGGTTTGGNDETGGTTTDGNDETVCCEAMTAECLACSEGVSVEKYCMKMPRTLGCFRVPTICCDGDTAECLACSTRQTVDEFCKKYPGTKGCTDEDCCDEITAECRACAQGVDVERFCTKFPSFPGCSEDCIQCILGFKDCEEGCKKCERIPQTCTECADAICHDQDDSSSSNDDWCQWGCAPSDYTTCRCAVLDGDGTMRQETCESHGDKTGDNVCAFHGGECVGCNEIDDESDCNSMANCEYRSADRQCQYRGMDEATSPEVDSDGNRCYGEENQDCRRADGSVLQHGESAAGVGDNWCNTERCMDGVIMTTLMLCPDLNDDEMSCWKRQLGDACGEDGRCQLGEVTECNTGSGSRAANREDGDLSAAVIDRRGCGQNTEKASCQVEDKIKDILPPTINVGGEFSSGGKDESAIEFTPVLDNSGKCEDGLPDDVRCVKGSIPIRPRREHLTCKKPAGLQASFEKNCVDDAQKAAPHYPPWHHGKRCSEAFDFSGMDDAKSARCVKTCEAAATLDAFSATDSYNPTRSPVVSNAVLSGRPGGLGYVEGQQRCCKRKSDGCECLSTAEGSCTPICDAYLKADAAATGDALGEGLRRKRRETAESAPGTLEKDGRQITESEWTNLRSESDREAEGVFRPLFDKPKQSDGSTPALAIGKYTPGDRDWGKGESLEEGQKRCCKRTSTGCACQSTADGSCSPICDDYLKATDGAAAESAAAAPPSSKPADWKPAMKVTPGDAINSMSRSVQGRARVGAAVVKMLSAPADEEWEAECRGKDACSLSEKPECLAKPINQDFGQILAELKANEPAEGVAAFEQHQEAVAKAVKICDDAKDWCTSEEQGRLLGTFTELQDLLMVGRSVIDVEDMYRGEVDKARATSKLKELLKGLGDLDDSAIEKLVSEILAVDIPTDTKNLGDLTILPEVEAMFEEAQLSPDEVSTIQTMASKISLDDLESQDGGESGNNEGDDDNGAECALKTTVGVAIAGAAYLLGP